MTPRRIARRRVAAAGAVLLLAVALSGCFAAQTVDTPPPSTTPVPSLDAPLAAARSQVAAALAPAGFQLRDAQVPYRPGEGPMLAAAPRAVVPAVIPAAPDAGFIVLYELPDAAAAESAAKEDADYIASGVGRVQFPADSRFVIRRLGPVVVFHAWSPGSSTAPNDEQALANALATVGQGYPIQP